MTDPHNAPTTGLGASPAAGPALLAPGEVLASRFRITRLLGRGGMGEVYEAFDLDLRTAVALKTIRPDLAANAEAMEHFRREIQLARTVTHPNVCRTFDIGRHHEATSMGEITFLTMELLAGETLEERLRERGRLTVPEAGPIVGQVAEALAAAHAAGVIHRDLKPGNVFLEQRKRGGIRAVVTDFGLACLAGDPQPTGGAGEVVVGTAAYMAPEQAHGRPATHSSDIYSLGLVLYEMVTGQRAQRGAPLPEHAASPRTVTPDLDPAWDAAILKCLERDPERRFASPLEVAAALGVRAPSAAPSRRPLWMAASLLAVGAAILWGLWRWATPRAAPRPTPIQVTSSIGLDMHPTFSPNGESLAYASDQGGSFQLYLRPLAAGSQEQALTSEGENFQPAWSPDGRWIAFHRRGSGVWVVPAQGGAARKLTDFGSRPAWSPDGQRLAFQSEPLVDVSANAFPALPPSTLWIVPRDGGTPRALTRPGQPPGGHGAPSWSPDGRRVVFGTADRRLAEIWTVDSDGRDLVRILHDQPYAFDPLYTPDGKQILYAGTSRASTYGIWSVRLSTADGRPQGGPNEVANLGSLRLRHVAISRDGRRVAYSALALVSNLWAIRLAATGETAGRPLALTALTDKSARPAFSPDGGRLAFDRGRTGGPTDIWVADADARGARPLTTGTAEDNLPSWFPDGRRIAFTTDRRGRFEVWSVGVDGHREEPLLALAQDVDWPRLSPDGRRVVFNSRQGGGTVNVWVADVGAGAPRQLTFERELAGFACWSPDGRALAVEVKRGEDTHVAVLAAEGGPLRRLTRDTGQSWPHSWSPDGEWIAFAGQRDGLWNVWAVSPGTGRQRRLTDHAKLNAYVRTPAWSPRGDRIAYEYAETTGNVWMVELPVRSGLSQP